MVKWLRLLHSSNFSGLVQLYSHVMEGYCWPDFGHKRFAFPVVRSAHGGLLNLAVGTTTIVFKGRWNTFPWILCSNWSGTRHPAFFLQLTKNLKKNIKIQSRTLMSTLVSFLLTLPPSYFFRFSHIFTNFTNGKNKSSQTQWRSSRGKASEMFRKITSVRSLKNFFPLNSIDTLNLLPKN